MEKQTLGHQQKYVTKNERVENLWKKLIGQETDLSEETNRMDGTTIFTINCLHAIRMCTDSLSKTKWRFLHGKRNTDTLRSRFPPQIRHRAYSEPCSVLGYRATGMENVPDRELPGMETGGKLKIES